MPNEPEKFGINYYLTSDMKSKYIENGFSFLGKDEMRQISISFDEFIILYLTELFTGRAEPLLQTIF